MTTKPTHPKALLFVGKIFAMLGTEAPAGSHGYYERGNSGHVKLFKLDSTLEALIVNNTRQGQCVVSAGLNRDGPFYMFSTSTMTEMWLGIEGWGRQAEVDAIEAMTYVRYDRLPPAAPSRSGVDFRAMTYADESALRLLAAERIKIKVNHSDVARQQLSGQDVHPIAFAVMDAESAAVHNQIRFNADLVKMANTLVDLLMNSYGLEYRG